MNEKKDKQLAKINLENKLAENDVLQNNLNDTFKLFINNEDKLNKVKSNNSSTKETLKLESNSNFKFRNQSLKDGSKQRLSRYRVLSIDGGGAKGYFTSYALHKLKEEFNINILDYFDMVVGTSTGAIISGSLLAGMSVEDLYNSYEENNEVIFQKEKILNVLKSPLLSQYSNSHFKEHLQMGFGKMNFKQLHQFSKKTFIFTGTNYNEGKPVIFGSPNIISLNKRYQNYLVWEAIYSSSAAPLYFDPHVDDITNDWIIDGGIWSNNPAIVGLMYSNDDFGYDPKDIEILSFGQTFVEELDFKPRGGKIKIKNFRESSIAGLYSATFLAQMNFLNLYLSKTLKQNYFRYSPELRINAYIDKVSDEFKEYTKLYYEENKHFLVNFIKYGKNEKYSKDIEKRYN